MCHPRLKDLLDFILLLFNPWHGWPTDFKYSFCHFEGEGREKVADYSLSIRAHHPSMPWAVLWRSAQGPTSPRLLCCWLQLFSQQEALAVVEGWWEDRSPCFFLIASCFKQWLSAFPALPLPQGFNCLWVSVISLPLFTLLGTRTPMASPVAGP